MHICYADDSGADKARTVTGLLVEVPHWNDFLGTWLDARLQLTKTWGVLKHAELHAVDLAKGRSRYCGENVEAEGHFTIPARLSAYRVLLNALAGFKPLTITTVGADSKFHIDVYGHFVDHLDRWAVENDTHVLVVYDGKSGEVEVDATSDEREAAMESAWRDHRPYRLKHRSLDLASRRIIEDSVVHDSRSSQLIQAADLVAYAAYQHRAHTHQDTWPKTRPIEKVWKAYAKLADRWIPGTDDGITWIDP